MRSPFLAGKGHRVFASMRDIVGKNRSYAGALRDQQIAVVELDVTDQASANRAVKSVLNQTGRIDVLVHIGSILGRVTFPFFGIYGASKFAVEALTDSLHCELSQLGVEVCLVQPSAYPTQMYASVEPSERERATEYGRIAAIPAAMFEHFMSVFQVPGRAETP
jgi:NAD(P)-dependent dehydrogenase (short-subunit alcohol dehydrogenase family)